MVGTSAGQKLQRGQRLRRASAKVQKENPDYKGDLDSKVVKLSDSNFKQWLQLDVKDEKALEKQLDMFVVPVRENAVIEIWCMNYCLSPARTSTVKLPTGIISIINDNGMMAMLEEATQDTARTALKIKPIKVIALNRFFKVMIS